MWTGDKPAESRIMNLSKRWVGVAVAAQVLGVSSTYVGMLVQKGKLTRRGERGSYTFDLVEVIRLRAKRARSGRPHGGRRTQLEELLRLATHPARSITDLGACMKRRNRRARRGL
jgi:hypothetical protein